MRQSLRVQSRHILPFWNNNLVIVPKALPFHPRTERHAHSSAHESQLSESVDVLAKAAGSPRGHAEMHCCVGHSLCITFSRQPPQPWRSDWRGFASAAPLSASLGEDWMPATTGSAGSYRWRGGALVLGHLSERISPLVVCWVWTGIKPTVFRTMAKCTHYSV